VTRLVAAIPLLLQAVSALRTTAARNAVSLSRMVQSLGLA